MNVCKYWRYDVQSDTLHYTTGKITQKITSHTRNTPWKSELDSMMLRDGWQKKKPNMTIIGMLRDMKAHYDQKVMVASDAVQV